ncbi:putative transmembrane protein [Toxoplasma gondii TgCatPRC2]|uniref:Transmembrane protein n=14 Tax=Toxoplasma gondii TaxID=5811 RepID=A0A125YNG3_TOXGV|nr:hypothetical protein TGGT1_220390 [Toxoplasma gondii GT1]ESS28465.1 putative transmembrane protein [Toxoplasma gondii VEG]KAF4643618.1 hypothetical protein TGRH88_023720 [Toxoplasma gondii]KFG28324.1 putative transmembrane protein [Toxoplasma gondii p89]KFG30471.1 putative transmembrane protein [Toxoplasma gondii GAB2-2007-GAL-DOM2]KFG35430.1 putative transmembrane protein [Toxoplasma gondii FOU]KFG63020.1 putative transmembrane protein [Toxoplasma gondii RUB]KFH00041.1 putative transmemb
MCDCLGKRLCRGPSRGMDLTYRDIFKLTVPFVWSIAACCLFAYYSIEPISNNRFPKTVPMYWSLISAFPAFMTALNIFIFHRDAVIQSGLSRVALAELTQVVRLISVVGVFTFITLAVASAVQLAQCRLCNNESYKENVIWCGISLVWMVVMACTTPTARHFSKLIFRYETFQQQGGMTPTVTCASPDGPPSLRPVSWGAVGSHPGGPAGSGNGAYTVAAGYPARGARTLGASGHPAEDDYIRAAAGASPGQVVTGKVSSKAESGKLEEGKGGS